MSEMFMELMLLAKRKLGNFSVVELFTTENNQELGNKLFLFGAKTRTDTFINCFPSLFVLLLLSSSQH